MTRDNTAYAKIRNRAENSQLQAKLKRIEREKQNEMRSLDMEKRRFKTKCSKLLPFSSSTIVKEVGDVVKQEPQSNLHNLVFTNGEVDAGKVLCLHLISAHRAETLTPPKRRQSYMCKEHSPTERLLEKSKRGYANNRKLSSLLPLYTIELFEVGATGESSLPPLINDGRLAARILINETIRELIGTVINALQSSNREKLRQLVHIAHDPCMLRSLLERKDILEFMDLLREHPLVGNSESFLLTPPFKIKTRDLNVRSVSGNLENLVKSIRQNVLQLPTRSWLIEEVEETVLKPRETRSSGMEMETTRVDNVDRSSKDTPAKKNTSEGQVTKREKIKRHTITNYIAKNIREAATVRRIEYDASELNDDVFSKKSSYDSAKVRLLTILTNPKESQSPLEDSEDEIATYKESMEVQNIQPPATGAAVNPKDEILKVHIKKTTCPACMEKWRTPLPLPKTPRVKKSSSKEGEVLKTNSRLRLSMLIDREMYTLKSYDLRYGVNESTAIKGNLKKRELATVQEFNLTSLDLARIEQEIREKETQKKLEIFLTKTD